MVKETSGHTVIGLCILVEVCPFCVLFFLVFNAVYLLFIIVAVPAT